MQLAQQTTESQSSADASAQSIKPQEDAFLALTDLNPVQYEAARRTQKQALFEIEELMRERRWEEITDLFHPVDEKLPELTAHRLDGRIREKIAFALGHVLKFDDAIAALQTCLQEDADNFYLHNSLAYTAYNSLYAAQNGEAFLSGRRRAERIRLAHRHFEKAQKLRPQEVTNYYRQGMLYKKIENKSLQSLELFRRAIANWERMGAEAKERRQQQRKNYIKALFQCASALLEKGDARQALKMIKTCLAKDEKSGCLSLVYKYFALGKVCFALNRYEPARDALLFAIRCNKQNQSLDFVYELLARAYLAMENASRALEVIEQVPEKQRRPYYCQTHADILCARGDFKGALAVLEQSQSRDRRSRHKSLMRMVKIAYALGQFRQARQYAFQADQFFKRQWGNHYAHALYWQGVSALRLGDVDQARALAQTLEDHHPHYPDLNKLKDAAAQGEVQDGSGPIKK